MSLQDDRHHSSWSNYDDSRSDFLDERYSDKDYLDEHYGASDECDGNDSHLGCLGEDDTDSLEMTFKAGTEVHDFRVLTGEEARQFLKGAAEVVSLALKVNVWHARTLLRMHSWDVERTIKRYQTGSELPFVGSSSPSDKIGNAAGAALNADFEELPVVPPNSRKALISAASQDVSCDVCLQSPSASEPEFHKLECGHKFCKECWKTYIEHKINDGSCAGIFCMEPNCQQPVPENFILTIIENAEQATERYHQHVFESDVSTHHHLRFCPGLDCNFIAYAKNDKKLPALCKCGTEFCFGCGDPYHAPASCSVVKRWSTKIRDDSETNNYVISNTKKCPKCAVIIDKDGGCNHITCNKCNYEFCWLCLGDWKKHSDGQANGRCVTYNPTASDNPPESETRATRTARESLKKYLFYYDRWLAQVNSIRMEEIENQKIEKHAQQLMKENAAPWLECEFRSKAIRLLRKCRQTLQYSYVYAYYMEDESHKSMFEEAQGLLYVAAENLSRKLQSEVPSEKVLTGLVCAAKAGMERLMSFFDM